MHSFRHTKQTSKNVADTLYMQKHCICSFVNVNIALNLHSYEENKSFDTGVHKEDVSFMAFKS